MPTQKFVQDARLNCKAIKGISSTLETLQKRSGYSQERFARTIGVTPLTYRRLLAGKANPMILLLYSISCRLNIELEQLLGFQPLDMADLDRVQEAENTPCHVDQQSKGPAKISADRGALSGRLGRRDVRGDDAFSRTAQDASEPVSAIPTIPILPGRSSS
jgi:transcriptional regulator with XRE-family HTH domain